MLAASEAAFTVLKIAGACHLAWLGISIFLKSFRKMAVAADVGPRPARSGQTGSPALPPVCLIPRRASSTGDDPAISAAGTTAPPAGARLPLVHNVEAMLWFDV